MSIEITPRVEANKIAFIGEESAMPPITILPTTCEPETILANTAPVTNTVRPASVNVLM